MIIEKEEKLLSLKEFERLVQVKWKPILDFENMSVLADFSKNGANLHKKGEMTFEQLWLGKYFQKEIISKELPDIIIKWINPQLGWGIFANRNFRKMEFIAEYTGLVRKKIKSDNKNAYCFEYVLVQGYKTPYTIDALDQGGISRYINHSDQPNLTSTLATYDDISHVIFYTKKPIAKGTQLCYDYGPDYWSKRTAPIHL